MEFDTEDQVLYCSDFIITLIDFSINMLDLTDPRIYDIN